MIGSSNAEMGMSNLENDIALNISDTSETPFGELPSALSRPAFNRTSTRRVYFATSILIGLILVGSVIVYLSGRSHVDPNAQHFVMEVEGMHCPLQCGLRMASALETIRWVIPESVTTNPKTGVVSFAVTSADAVNEDEIHHVVEQAGFGFKSLAKW
jgi:hypothetical protein